MVQKARSAGQTAISVSMPKAMVEEIDARAERLGLNRSQYLLQLAKQDLEERSPIVLREASPAETTNSGQTAAADVAATTLSNFRKRRRPSSKKTSTPQ